MVMEGGLTWGRKHPVQYIQMMPWLVWLSGLSATLQTKGSLVQFPDRAHTWFACGPGPH